ncbi:MAG: hypothetical protein QXW62_00340 [Candidatus Methanomethylicaceae archaeon]|nr:hypothetical protein [Candidatus Verstraetearchaeota archaeon]
MIEFGEGKHKVWLSSFNLGNELLIIIGGGEKPHIGSISLCTGTPPISISLINHKDYIISHNAAWKIHKKYNCNVIVICGIHIDNATKEDIEILLRNSEKCIEKFINSSNV